MTLDQSFLREREVVGQAGFAASFNGVFLRDGAEEEALLGPIGIRSLQSSCGEGP